MHIDLSDDQITHYRERGFLVVEDVLDATEVAELASGVQAAVELLGKRKIAGNGTRDWTEGDAYYDKVFLQRLNLWRLNTVVARYMLGAGGVADMAIQLAGMPLRCYHDQTLQKAPWANPTSWHLDDPYWPFYTRDAISVWIALDDATLTNGCLHFLPGSHQMTTYDNVGIGENVGDLFRVYPQLGAIEPVSAPVRAGAALFHNGLTAHGAGANMTPRWRRAMTCAYMPEGATYNGHQGILSQRLLATLKEGDVLEDEEDLPRVGSAAMVRSQRDPGECSPEVARLLTRAEAWFSDEAHREYRQP